MKNLLSIVALLAILYGCGNAENSSSSEEEDTQMENTMEEETMGDDMSGEEEMSDIIVLASETESLSTLVSAVKAAELVETLQGEGPFTVFAPTNAAFEALDEGVLEDLLKPENKEKLAAILTYHVVAGEVMSTDLSDGMEAETVNGQTITISTTEGVKINDANVTAADVKASNGVVHIIDKVILPEME